MIEQKEVELEIIEKSLEKDYYIRVEPIYHKKIIKELIGHLNLKGNQAKLSSLKEQKEYYFDKLEERTAIHSKNKNKK
jgi:hypothetical protein